MMLSFFRFFWYDRIKLLQIIPAAVSGLFYETAEHYAERSCVKMKDKMNADPGRKQKTQKMSQGKQIAIMAGALAVCAVMITWTVILMRQRLGLNDTSEQSSGVDVMELPPEDYLSTTTTDVTAANVRPWSEEDITTAKPKETDPNATTTSTSATNATAATAPLATQAANFVRRGTTARQPAATQATAAPAAPTTHTQAQQPPQTTVQPQETQPQTPAPVSPPTGAQIPYSQLLAMYLSAQHSGGTAYFADGFGNAQPMVILGNDHGLFAVSPVGDISKTHRLGGTGDDNPYPTAQPYRLYQCDGGSSRAVYFTSTGADCKTVGYIDAATCRQVWASIKYTQAGAEWQTNYTIMNTAADGTSAAVSTNQAAAAELFGNSDAFNQEFSAALQAAGIQTGDPASYPEFQANESNDSSTLWSKAGSYNSGFSLQGNGAYGVVITVNDNANLRAGTTIASNIVASIPPGSFLSVDRSGTVNGWVPVSALVNGTWHSGYMSSELLMTWNPD